MAAEVVDRDDGGVIHLRDDLRLAEEPLLHLRRQVVRGDELDGDVAVEEGISGPVDDAHASAAELPQDLVPVGEFRVDQSRGLGQGRPGV